MWGIYARENSFFGIFITHSTTISKLNFFIFSDDSDTEEAMEINMSKKKPSREQICRDNLDQGMKVIFDYIKENVDSANDSPSIIMSLYDDILKVIYQGVLTTIWMRLSKLLHSFGQPLFNNYFSLFQLLQLFNFYKQWWPYLVSI